MEGICYILAVYRCNVFVYELFLNIIDVSSAGASASYDIGPWFISIFIVKFIIVEL